jgi:hypothetical protein
MPAPIVASAPVYVDVPVASVQTVQAPPIITCALPFGTLYGHPVEPKLQPVIVDGVTVDYLPLCQTYSYEPFLDCTTAYYYYADQNLFYCVVPAYISRRGEWSPSSMSWRGSLMSGSTAGLPAYDTADLITLTRAQR